VHLIISNPQPVPEVVAPPPPGAEFRERLAYEAKRRVGLVACRTQDRREIKRILRDECEPELVEWAGGQGIPPSLAPSIVRSKIRAAIEADTAYRESPYGRAEEEIVRTIAWVSRRSTERGERVVVKHPLPGHPAQMFLDRNPEKGAFGAFAELAAAAVEMLAGLGLLPTEARPDASDPVWSDTMKDFYIRQWMLFVYRFAGEHPELALLSPELPMLDGLPLEHCKARRLLLGVFASSAFVLEKILALDAPGEEYITLKEAREITDLTSCQLSRATKSGKIGSIGEGRGKLVHELDARRYADERKRRRDDEESTARRLVEEWKRHRDGRRQ
jgi:hypothetical protein